MSNRNTVVSSQYADLNAFLHQHSLSRTENNADGAKKATHTRIPSKELKIHGGSYYIPKEELPIFYKLYYTSIFDGKNREYLTEKQSETNGPIAIDFDLKYKTDVTTKQHTSEHVADMISICLNVIQEIYTVTPGVPVPIFVFEKPNVNVLSDVNVTKDGLHVLIGVQACKTIQTIFREKLVTKMPDIWSDLPLINDWESIIDGGVSSRSTNWQLLGSKKPGNETYALTQYFVNTLDDRDNNFAVDEKPVAGFNLKQNFAQVSVQYEDHVKFELNPSFVGEYNRRANVKSSLVNKKKPSNVRLNLIVDTESQDTDTTVTNIVDADSLINAVQIMLNGFEANEYEKIETHEYAQALGPRFYEPGSHALNRQVAFALKHTSDKLFWSWVLLRSKASDFEYATIPALKEEWDKMHSCNSSNKSVTRKSILYWVRSDNPDEYDRIQKNTLEYVLERACDTGTEYDLACVLRQMFKDKYTCVSYDKKGVWYAFNNHRWSLDKKISLRQSISEDLYRTLSEKSDRLQEEMLEYDNDDDRKTRLAKKIKRIGEVRMRLKKTTDKNNIMREAAEIFYDDSFIQSMDTNPQLMCFNNGVIDFSTKTFRDGMPEDYITKTTKIDYIPHEVLTSAEYAGVVAEVTDFMEKIFPIPELNRYMWDHLSSCLIGNNKNQTFNVYHGSGSNGKSMVTDLMTMAIGNYKGIVPITLVTEKRGLIGGTSSEVLQLKGVRYAVMQEASKGMKLNEGVLKELTGGDPLQARGLYVDTETFDPQFNLVVCTNNLFDIESNDDGTWRRIRKCDFPSKFVDDGEHYNDVTQYVFKKDKGLKAKLKTFAPVFASMLVKRAFETNGIVADCQLITDASKKYRMNQDHISAFISEKIRKTDDPTDKIIKTGLYAAFKLWFQQEQGLVKMPKGEELHEVMTKRHGEYTRSGWVGVAFVEPDEDDDAVEGGVHY